MTTTYFNPNKYILGKTAIEDLGPIMKQNGATKALVVFGSGSAKRNGVYDRVVKALKTNSIDFIELWGVQANPLLEKVHEGIAVAKDKNNSIDTVLAVGGGSVIDTAKAISAGALFEGEIYDVYRRKVAPPTAHLPVYAVLTLSASASENDAGTVISCVESKEKLAAFIGGHPVACAVDPTVQMSLPWYQVMAGAADALSHLMEGMLSNSNASITGRFLNFSIQKSVLDSMTILLQNPNDYNARENFCWAVSLALRGETRMGPVNFDGNVHGLEHCLSVYDDKITHGAGLAALAPTYYKFLHTKPIAAPSLDLWSKEVMGEVDFQKGIEKFSQILLSWKAPAGLKALGITEEKQIDEILEIWKHQYELGRRSSVYNPTLEEVKQIYMDAMKQ